MYFVKLVNILVEKNMDMEHSYLELRTRVKAYRSKHSLSAEVLFSTLYLIETPFANRADLDQDELPDQGLLCLLMEK